MVNTHMKMEFGEMDMEAPSRDDGWNYVCDKFVLTETIMKMAVYLHRSGSDNIETGDKLWKYTQEPLFHTSTRNLAHYLKSTGSVH